MRKDMPLAARLVLGMFVFEDACRTSHSTKPKGCCAHASNTRQRYGTQSEAGAFGSKYGVLTAWRNQGPKVVRYINAYFGAHVEKRDLVCPSRRGIDMHYHRD